MDVFEQVQREQGRFVPRWAIDHAETVRDEELRRIKAMGGGIAIQNRMAFAGEYFVERYGKDAARHAPPVRKMLQMGIPVGAGTDGTRVSSYNPWPSLYWLVSGKTVGGTQLFADDNKLSREEALRLFTVGQRVVQPGGDRQGPHRAGPVRRLRRAQRRLLHRSRGADQEHRVAADGGGRQGGLCREAVRRPSRRPRCRP